MADERKMKSPPQHHCFIICVAILLLLLMGCQTLPTIYPKCRHYAVLQALAFGEQYPVRIGVGPTTRNPEVWHAQAEALIGGKWMPLSQQPTAIYPANRDHYKPIRYVGIQEALKWWKIAIRKGVIIGDGLCSR
jgi:hypothetical protein